MVNNDIVRRLRYTFDIKDQQMVEIFKSGGYDAVLPQVISWLKRETDTSYVEMLDYQLAGFLNGFINLKRGKKEGEQAKPEKSLTNNVIFRKLKIALNLKDTDILDILDSVDMRVSKHELSALFRNPTQSQYRVCKDQFLRVFLQGVQKRYRKL